MQIRGTASVASVHLECHSYHVHSGWTVVTGIDDDAVQVAVPWERRRVGVDDGKPPVVPPCCQARGMAIGLLAVATTSSPKMTSR
jgi:hypothetical protein